MGVRQVTKQRDYDRGGRTDKENAMLWAAGTFSTAGLDSNLPMSALRILIVDDNERIRTSIARVLSDETAWAICGEARTSREALDAAIATAPDVILLDVNLPDAQGSDTVSLIRTQLPHVTVVLISANSVGAMSAAAQQSGADAWLDKSLLATDLVPTIRSLCDH